METVRVGLIGFGTVGSSFFRLIEKNGGLFAERLGVAVEIAKVCDQSPEKVNAPAVVADYRQIVEDPQIAVVIELVGGTEVAYEIIKSALLKGKHVITANKALLALRGDELFQLAGQQGVKLKFEASVGGGIPIIKVVRESLIGNRIEKIRGILNGTSNYILTRMSEEGLSFPEALREAQARGFAESDPSLDVQGGDAAHKISLLASLSFGQWIDYRRILCEGITSITPEEIEFAAASGFVYKLIASAEWVEGKPAVTVFPALLSQEHPLAVVRNELNAVYLASDFLGTSVYLGKGAGGEATASSVASDLGDLVEWMILKAGGAAPQSQSSPPAELYPSEAMSYRYFFHFITENRPGIWATVTSRLAENKINIESVHQKWEDRSKPSDLYVLVDAAPEAKASKALKEISACPGISADSRFYRILA